MEPWKWLEAHLNALSWPVIVSLSFWLGRYVTKWESRLNKAEDNINLLMERHLPAVHRALAEIRGLLTK